MTIKVRHALTNACDVLADVSAVKRCDLIHFDPLCCGGGNECFGGGNDFVCACVCVVCVCVNTFSQEGAEQQSDRQRNGAKLR